MPKKPGEEREVERKGEGPRTDLPPTREPYDDDDDYFGTGEEENVVKEREAPDAGKPGER